MLSNTHNLYYELNYNITKIKKKSSNSWDYILRLTYWSFKFKVTGGLTFGDNLWLSWLFLGSLQTKSNSTKISKP